MMSERAVLPDIGKLDQDSMSQVGYPTRVVGKGVVECGNCTNTHNFFFQLRLDPPPLPP